jgi:hypothetical protein
MPSSCTYLAIFAAKVSKLLVIAAQNNVVSRRFDRVSPATQRQDALHVGQFLEVLSMFCRFIDDGLPGFGLDVAESTVHVCV